MNMAFKIVLGLIFSYAVFFSSEISALKRDFRLGSILPYCKEHVCISEDCIEIKEYLNLLPLLEVRCKYIICSACNRKVWLEEIVNDDEDNSPYFAYSCKCLWDMWNRRGRIGRYPPKFWLPTWQQCHKNAIYQGYTAHHFKKYFSLLKSHLEYSKNYKNCRCYWPELSSEAAKISDKAYELFIDLFTNTALSSLVENKVDQSLYFQYPNGNLRERGLTLVCICHAFFFSSYYYICKDLKEYSKDRFSDIEYEKIEQKLDDILEALSPFFYELYDRCLLLHENEYVQNDRQFLELLEG